MVSLIKKRMCINRRHIVAVNKDTKKTKKKNFQTRKPQKIFVSFLIKHSWRFVNLMLLPNTPVETQATDSVNLDCGQRFMKLQKGYNNVNKFRSKVLTFQHEKS
jgi:hypothetical protein